MGIDWPGLLKWSLQYADGTSTTDPRRPDQEERMKFLEAALKEAMGGVEAPEDIVKEATAKLKEDHVSEVNMISALRLIENCVDNFPEISRNLHKLGALVVLLDLAFHQSQTVSSISLQTLSFALGNNPELQREAYRLGFLSRLLQFLQEEVESLPHFSALANLVRQEKDIEKSFFSGGGSGILERAVISVDPKIQTKAANLIGHFMVDEIHESITPSLMQRMSEAISREDDRTIQLGECLAAASLAFTRSLAKNRNDGFAEASSLMRSSLRNRLVRATADGPFQRHYEIQMINEALRFLEKAANSG